MSGLWNETKAWEQGNTGLLKVLVQNRRLPVYHMESGIYYADLAGKSGPGIKSQKILLKALLIGQIKRYRNGTEGKPDQKTRRVDQGKRTSLAILAQVPQAMPNT